MLLFGCLSVNAQTLPIGFPVLEDYARRSHIQGEFATASSFVHRPNLYFNDSLFHEFQGTLGKSGGIFSKKRQKLEISLFPLQLRTEFNSHHPYGRNNGLMIRSKGLQTLISTGVLLKWKFLRVELRPEFLYAQNSSFETLSQSLSENAYNFYYQFYHNVTDLPERYGEGNYTKFFAGQSGIFVDWKKVTFGLSSNNQWKGPGIRNSLLQSNNARGIPQLSIFSNRPIDIKIGKLEFHLLGGRLDNSGITPPVHAITGVRPTTYIPKASDWRYISALHLTYQPKWINGLYLGFQRNVTINSGTINDFIDYVPFIDNFFKVKDPGRINEEERDEVASVYLKWNWFKANTEFYFEIGKNDHSIDLRDFFLSPNHSWAYTAGLTKIFDLPDNESKIVTELEVSDISRSGTGQLRSEASWYVHSFVRDGYTHYGEVIGAGIGPGSTYQYFNMAWTRGLKQVGLFFERTINNRDFAIITFEEDNLPSRRAQGISENTNNHNWVDLSLGTKINWQKGKLLINANLQYVRSFNYQWQNSIIDPLRPFTRNSAIRGNLYVFWNLAYFL
ncbi:hypothetical protein BFP71_03575 [Roseivirga misakiensis]|uniref:Capsule assembly Wzi family protein n=2 Tax=Roseivirga misakiensis TaxID=1563681 RepID=A0A1E5T5W0_9BACT|nr:hypothetical protein BFP71_03575 [Roseivirga misakiensis]